MGLTSTFDPKTWIGIAESIDHIVVKHKDRKFEDQKAVADYYNNLGNLLNEISSLMKEGIRPSGKCSELSEYAENMAEHTKKVIGKRKAERYSKKVKSAYLVENYFDDYMKYVGYDSNNLEFLEQIELLEKAAGSFRGIATHIELPY